MYAKRQPKEGLGNVQDISVAWESAATDLFEFRGNIYLIMSCRFSGYIIVLRRQLGSVKVSFLSLECPTHSIVIEVPILLVYISKNLPIVLI